jgi:CRISPR/Cas system CSM-associated protein Csm4 (group 5 of RAMP superfamily)
MEFCETPTLESEGKDSIDEHGSFILETPQEQCSFNASQESGMLCASIRHEKSNHLKFLSCKTFRRLVVDAFVYHKHCKFGGCNVAITMQLKLHNTSTIGGERGTSSPMIAARGHSHC